METDREQHPHLLKKPNELTPAAEDYLAVIYRMSCGDGEEVKPVRICALAEKLCVSPSSASRMAQSMALWGYLDFKRYGYITMTDDGRMHGEYLMRRHETVKRFFSELGGGESERDIEKLEHYITPQTVEAMQRRLCGAAAPGSDTLNSI